MVKAKRSLLIAIVAGLISAMLFAAFFFLINNLKYEINLGTSPVSTEISRGGG